jgi:hypothetical protein
LKTESGLFYLDATDPVLGFGHLDPLCYNGHARIIIADNEPLPVELNADTLTERKITSVFIINNKGKLTGSLQQAPGYAESSSIRTFIKANGTGKLEAEIKNNFRQEVEINNLRIDSLNKKEEPVGINYNFAINTDKEDIIYLNPMLGEGYSDNPFISAQRFYPVEMPYTLDEVYTVRLDIPDGYSTDEIPKSLLLKLNEEGDGLFEYRISEAAGTLSLRCRLQIKRTLFAPEEYELLREFFSRVVKKQNEQIVFKKKSN